MKTLNFFVFCFSLAFGFTNAQTFQNTTATTDAIAETRIGGCGYNVQPGVQMSAITIPVTGTISDASKITVNVALTSSWLGDVTLDLISPEGQAITLIRRIGATLVTSCGDSSDFVAANILGFNSANTTLIDAAGAGPTVAIPSGNYAPTYGNAPYPTHNPGTLAAFLQGKQLDGDWRLILYDYGTGEPSTIASWQIIVANGALLKTSNLNATFGSDISLKQNPVEDYLLLDINSKFNSLSLDIYDASGKIVKKENILKNVTDVRVNVQTLPAGMYLLNPTMNGEKIQPIKFIKK
ncbi:T9SS type A sorting domain-containing protein [Frigoriflavimonas asaccharolytica]|uniref:Subtilisin-like proprotein convertase family protein n=1 Tax=Frigoriflavimonas asaccharolytica TaxID=2735899 RepID=A0A8J8G7U2_9FLAO|nr:T9SS type A sorting domain-containing protein [Frigoriflavimonas asaccharolytica]NRS92556.1 subtilisin-like proprotein convertase family protein [Frigoriflavimonas asaccharolytica]